jgi:hypothetical protein
MIWVFYLLLFLSLPIWAVLGIILWGMSFALLVWVCGGKIYISEGKTRLGYIRWFKYYE